ncbi:MAG: hypothetical protein V1860_01810 [bacterium]
MMKKIIIIIIPLSFFYLYFFKYFSGNLFTEKIKNSIYPKLISSDVVEFSDEFNVEEIIQETGKMEKSFSSDWWLNSGGLFIKKNGVGSTAKGELAACDKWRIDYQNYNPESTDDGFHPQNIFRLVLKKKLRDFSQETYFRIVKNNFSKSIHRNESNGILFFNRYKDGDNLYYAGLRVDGAAVIKKKINGEYFTIAYRKIFNGSYDREKNLNLLPAGKWIGLKTEIYNIGEDVNLKIYMDKDNSGNWDLALEATDNGSSFGGAALSEENYAGIRTDFMDVDFDNYKIKSL